VWVCATCYTCQERCPQGVRIADVMRALKNIAVRLGTCGDRSFSVKTTSSPCKGCRMQTGTRRLMRGSFRSSTGRRVRVGTSSYPSDCRAGVIQ